MAHEHKSRMNVKLPKKHPTNPDPSPALTALTRDKLLNLQEYLQVRLKDGRQRRDERLPRMLKIDRLISTWRKHTAEDSKRLKSEDVDGRQTAVAGNLPVLAAHLEDITAFYADTLSPQSNPFISTAAGDDMKALIKRLSRDVQARNYYGEVAAAARAMIKYNIGGVTVRWDTGSASSTSMFGIQGAGNAYQALPMHNTFWDSAIVDPRHLSTQGEWGAHIDVTNRATLLRRAAKGEIYDIARFIDSEASEVTSGGRPMSGSLKLWFNPAHSLPTKDGSDSLTGDEMPEAINWSELGLGMPEDSSSLMKDQFELTYMYCWLVPEEHGLLSAAEKAELIESAFDPKTFIELWRFELVNNFHIIKASPHSPRSRTMKDETPIIPMFLTHMIEDELGDSQRATMELVAGFQRLSSSIFEIGIGALRKDVWGHSFVDPEMFDVTKLESGSTAGVHQSKQPGRDVRTGFGMLSGSNGASQAFSYVGSVLDLKNSLFPSQALPAQIAGLDRAVTNQVSSIVHGAQRGMRMSLRLVDQSVFLPARIETARNLSRYEELVSLELDDETVAKELGSGIESLESERITEALWRLTMSIVQNREAMEKFDVGRILSYLAQVLRINEDFSTFIRQPDPAVQGGQQQQPGEAAGLDPNDPANQQAMMAAQGNPQ